MLKGKLYAKLTRSFLRKWWLVIMLALALLIGGLFVLVCFTALVNYVIDSQLPLTEGSLTYDLWRKPPINPVMKIYIYNVTNVDEFLDGQGHKPVIQEIGPYVYLETWEKVNLKQHENGTVTFNQRKTFAFAPELSNGSEDDVVVMPNVPLLSATSKSKPAPKFIRITINFMAKLKEIKPFVEVTVGQLLWGYEDPLMELAKEMSPDTKLPFEKFGLLVGKNDTSPNNVTMFTGATDMTKFGIIERVNGESMLSHYSGDFCNRIDGSDGSVFPPHMTRDTVIHVYDKDLCRRLPLKFQKEIVAHGDVMGYRFVPPADVFAETSVNKDNACFCPTGTDCAPHGTFNVSACAFESPVVLSFPHFLNGDDRLRQAVIGLTPPDQSKHESFLDINPSLGVPLRGKLRLQVNLAVSHVKDIEVVATFPDIVMPLMWFEDGIEQLPDDISSLVKIATEAPPIARTVLLYVLFTFGTILLAISVFCLVRTSNSRDIMVVGNAAQFAANDAQKKTPPPPSSNGFVNEKSVDAKDNAAFVAEK